MIFKILRKRYKNKKHSCKLCKPHKAGWEVVYKAKELNKLKEFEKVKNETINNCKLS